MRQRNAAIDAEKLVIISRFIGKRIKVVFGRLFFDDDRYVLQQIGELRRKIRKCLLDQLFEFVRGNEVAQTRRV